MTTDMNSHLHGETAHSVLNAGRDLLSPQTTGNLPMNIGNRERVVSLVLGAAGILWLGKRLFGLGALAALSVYLLYRGLTGYCAIYGRAQVNTRHRGETTPAGQPDKTPAIHTHPAPERPAGGVESGAVERNSVTVGNPPATITVERPRKAARSEHSGPNGGIQPDDERERGKRGTPVDEASKESFPASDPPALNTASA